MARKEEQKNITIEDLKRVDLDKARAELTCLEEKLADYVAQAQREIDGRKAFIKAIEVLIHGKPARKPWGSKRKKSDTATDEDPAPARTSASSKPADTPESHVRKQGRPSHADKIADVLKQRGKLAARDIAKQLGITEESARHHLQNDERFDCDGVGLWELV